MEATLGNVIESYRSNIEKSIQSIISLKGKIDTFQVCEKEDRGEVIANITLALRHLEDAKMRLGKVYQAIEGGVSNNPR